MRSISRSPTSPWVVVLPTGKGGHGRPLTERPEHESVPKQFWSVGRRGSMLRQALARAKRLAPPQRIVPVVSTSQRAWWESEVVDLPGENILLQPADRGTAVGILLSLVHVWRRDPEASLVVLPSDHYVEQEWTVVAGILRALAAVALAPRRIVLLGVTVDRPDPGYGWIRPAEPEKDLGVRRVYGFIEKAHAAVAAQLLRSGALVNSFMFAARVDTLLALFRSHLPALTDSFLAAAPAPPASWSPQDLTALYETLPSADFSQHLLETETSSLSVLPLPGCGWNDLGTPERVERCLKAVDARGGTWPRIGGLSHLRRAMALY